MKSGRTLPELRKELPLVKQKINLFLKRTSWWDVAILTAGIILALLLRYLLRTFESGDYTYYFRTWYTKIQQEGFHSLGEAFSDYPPLYLSILYVLSVVFPKISAWTVIKLPSIACDLVCAWYVYRIVRLKYGHGVAAGLSSLAVLFAPTVVLNGAVWGQIESVYTAALLACVYYLLRKKNWLACVAFGLALSIKLQSAYLVPFLFALWLKKGLSFKQLLVVPAVYLVSILPAWIAGRPIFELITLYVAQVGDYKGLVNNGTSIYTWLPHADFNAWYIPGIIYAAAICLIYVYLIIKSRVESLYPYLVHLALASLLIVPFFLPKTHDRYFYPADVLSIVFGFYYPEFFFIPIIINLVSFFIYQPFLFGVDIFPQSVLALIMFLAILFVIWRMVKQLYPQNHSAEKGEIH